MLRYIKENKVKVAFGAAFVCFALSVLVVLVKAPMAVVLFVAAVACLIAAAAFYEAEKKQ